MARNTEQDPLTVQPLHLIIQDAIDLCANKIKVNGVKLTFEYDGTLQVRCCPIEISQAMINLIQNAVDAIHLETKKELVIKTHSGQKVAYIDVCDSGPPIPAKIRSKILSPFFSTKPQGEGTGLGLGVTQSILKRHGGTLELLPTEQTCFRVCLPLA